MKLKITELHYYFHIFNSRYFKFGRNKMDTLLGVDWVDLSKHKPPLMGRTSSYRSLSGKPDSYRIQINKADRKSPRVWKMTLIHEMVHFKLYGKDKSRASCRSRMFQSEMKRLANAGAFNGLW